MIRLNLLGYKGLVALQKLQEDHLPFIGEVVIGRDKNVTNDYYHELKALCQERGIYSIERNQKLEDNREYTICIGWRWLVKSEGQIIVFHDSLLPKYRGFNPLVSCLINGEKEIGMTALFAEKAFDAGPIIDQRKIRINYPIKIERAIQLVSELYGKSLNRILELIRADSIQAREQDHSLATYSVWRDEVDYRINWNWHAEKIVRFINAVQFPYKGAETELSNEILSILDADVVDDVVIENRHAGKVLFKDELGLVIICGKGLLRVSKFYHEDGSEYDYSKKFRLRFG